MEIAAENLWVLIPRAFTAIAAALLLMNLLLWSSRRWRSIIVPTRSLMLIQMALLFSVCITAAENMSHENTGGLRTWITASVVVVVLVLNVRLGILASQRWHRWDDIYGDDGVRRQ